MAGNKLVIALCGRKEAGKSTAGDWLVRNHGFHEVALAGPLRSVAVQVYNSLHPDAVAPLTVDMCTNQATKEVPLFEWQHGFKVEAQLHGKPLTPRALLQWLGTDVCRTLMGEDVWLRAAVGAIAASGQTRIVVTDMRFLNEANMLPDLLQAHGFRVVRVRLADPSATPLGADAHASEREADELPVDVTVVNDKTAGISNLYTALARDLTCYL